MSHATRIAPRSGAAPGSVAQWQQPRPDESGASSDARIGIAVRGSANEQFKRNAASVGWIALALAVLVHFLLFRYYPEFGISDVSYTPGEIETVQLPPEIEIPPPPEQIARPATPVVAADELVDEDITIAPTTFEANPIENLPPPPPSSGGDDIAAAPAFTPYSVAPELKNRADVAQALLRYYPPVLRDARIDGTVLIWFFIDENGRVQKTQVHTSSGYSEFDRAALRVADIMQFSPALNRDQRVPVWVAMPIIFQVM